jgi:hypothetical protein
VQRTARETAGEWGRRFRCGAKFTSKPGLRSQPIRVLKFWFVELGVTGDCAEKGE